MPHSSTRASETQQTPSQELKALFAPFFSIPPKGERPLPKDDRKMAKKDKNKAAPEAPKVPLPVDSGVYGELSWSQSDDGRLTQIVISLDSQPPPFVDTNVDTTMSPKSGAIPLINVREPSSEAPGLDSVDPLAPVPAAPQPEIVAEPMVVPDDALKAKPMSPNKMKSKKVIRKLRSIVAQDPLLKLLLGRQLAGQVKEVLDLIGKGEEVVLGGVTRIPQTQAVPVS